MASYNKSLKVMIEGDQDRLKTIIQKCFEMTDNWKDE
jgi:hypothetical protein